MRVTIVLHGLYYVLDNISSQSFLLYIFWWLYNGYQSSLEFVSLITNEAEHFFSNFIDFLDSLFSEDRSAKCLFFPPLDYPLPLLPYTLTHQAP